MKLVPFDSGRKGKSAFKADKDLFMVVILENILTGESPSSRWYILGDKRDCPVEEIKRLVRNFKRTKRAKTMDYEILIYDDKGENVLHLPCLG